MNAAAHLNFAHAWQTEILRERPMILPPRHYTYPHQAEEVERGALEVMIRPASDAPFLATFALGFADPVAPTGVWSCPAPAELCAVAGGYAYIVDTHDPQRFTHLPLRPVLEVVPLTDHRLLLFAGSYDLLAWGANGLAWQTPRLSHEGIRLGPVSGHTLHGFGWDLLTDREIPFAIDLRTGQGVDQAPQTR